jgi:glutamate dehydrogenase
MRMKPPKNRALSPAVGRAIDRKFGRTRAESVRLFLRQFYASSPTTELQRASVGEILDPVLMAWEFVQNRPSRSPQIKFIEYTHTGHGNQNTGTCILILVDDMPFLVDSIRQGLNRAGAHIKRVRNSVIYARRAGRGEARPGKLKRIAAKKDEEFKAEALICVNCAHIDARQARRLETETRDTLRHVASAVKDYSAMCERALSVRDALLAKYDLLSSTHINLMESCSAQAAVNEWAAAHAEEISKTQAILTRLRAEPKPGYAMFSVVLREMLNLAQSTSYKQ